MEACAQPLGMEDFTIPDENITASTYWIGEPFRGRLNYQGFFGSWRGSENGNLQWLQIYLASFKKVTKIATQGNRLYDWWLTQFAVAYSNESTDSSFIKYQENGGLKVICFFPVNITLFFSVVAISSSDFRNNWLVTIGY